MRHQINCTPGYDPTVHKFCSKCGISNHHEFECARYYHYNPNRCKLCAVLYHYTSDCTVITKKLGYKPNDSQAQLVALLIMLETSYKISQPTLANAQASDAFCSTKQKDILQTTSREKAPKYILYESILYRAFPTEDPKVTKFVLCIPTSLMGAIITNLWTHLKRPSKSGILKSFMGSFFHPMAKKAIHKCLNTDGFGSHTV